MIQLKKETVPDFHTAGQLLFEYFNCRLESQPAVSDMPADVSDMSMLINTTIPKLAFWCDIHEKYSYSAQELYEGTNLWDDHESMLNDLMLSETLEIINCSFDTNFAFSHDLYQGFFAALFVYRLMELAVKEQETFFLKNINCCWSNNIIQFIPDMAVCYQKPLYTFYNKMYSLLEKNDQYSQILWNLTQSIGSREDLFRQQSQYKDLYIRFLNLSVRQNVAPAYFAANRFYSDGKLIEPDIEKARYYLKKAADEGVAEAQLQLAEEYFQSTEKAVQNLAFEYCSRAANQKNCDAQFRLAEAWSRGEGTPWPDDGKSFELYRAAAEQGHTEAEYKYACALYWGIGTPAVDREYEIDRLLYSASSLPEAQFMIAHYCLNESCQDFEASPMYWFRKAAKQGHAKSQYRLACLIIEDLDYCEYVGFENARAEAIQWLEKAATGGIYAAAYLLRLIYSAGLWKIEQNQECAEKWKMVEEANREAYQSRLRNKRRFLSQYDHLNPYGQYLRGIAIIESQGRKLTANQYKLAMSWFKLAADQGHLGARNYLDSFETIVAPKYGLTVLELAELVHALEESMGLVPPRANSQQKADSVLNRLPSTRQINESSAMPLEKILPYKDRFLDYLEYDDRDDKSFYRDVIPTFPDRDDMRKAVRLIDIEFFGYAANEFCNEWDDNEDDIPLDNSSLDENLLHDDYFDDMDFDDDIFFDNSESGLADEDQHSDVSPSNNGEHGEQQNKGMSSKIDALIEESLGRKPPIW